MVPEAFTMQAPAKLLRFLPLALSFVPFLALEAQELKITALKSGGNYAKGEEAGWRVEPVTPPAAGAGAYHYSLKRNGAVELKSGILDFSKGPQVVSSIVNEAAMLQLELNQDGGKRQLAGAAIAPTQLQPVEPVPADFDRFWDAQVERLKQIPANPKLSPEASGREGVEYATLQMDNIDGSHVYGQLAKPTREGKFPAMLLLQWAGGPYRLEKTWATDKAAEGWLVLNIEPHDVPGNLPTEFYAALPQMLKSYNTIYHDDRERCYFLRMYLGAVRAAEYLAQRPDWDGKILVAHGTSMGGQQCFAVAGLSPRITHVVAHVPAGADANAALHGRAESYPNWDKSNPAVMQTARYFDTIHFAHRIRATCLFSAGYIDEACAPAGLWTLYNVLPCPKEFVPLPEAAHNHVSTQAQQQAYLDRAKAWLDALVRGEAAPLR